jgi:hypothetical protein
MKKFCLLTSGRAGSTALMDRIALLPEVAVPGKDIDCRDQELTHPKQRRRIAAAYAELTGRPINTIPELVDGFYRYHAGAAFAGFKTMVNRHPDIADFVRREDIQFIVLRRKDIAATVASFKERCRNKWYVSRVGWTSGAPSTSVGAGSGGRRCACPPYSVHLVSDAFLARLGEEQDHLSSHRLDVRFAAEFPSSCAVQAPVQTTTRSASISPERGAHARDAAVLHQEFEHLFLLADGHRRRDAACRALVRRGLRIWPISGNQSALPLGLQARLLFRDLAVFGRAPAPKRLLRPRPGQRVRVLLRVQDQQTGARVLGVDAGLFEQRLCTAPGRPLAPGASALTGSAKRQG